MFGWWVGWLVGFFLFFFFCADVLVDLVLQKVLGLSSSSPSFFWSGNLYLVEDKLRYFFLPPFTEVWCQGNNVSVITTVINCLLKQRVCYLWEEIVSKTFASWYMVLVPSLNSLLLKWRWIEMVVFYMSSICLCKDCPRADNLVFFLWSTTTSIY